MTNNLYETSSHSECQAGMFIINKRRSMIYIVIEIEPDVNNIINYANKHISVRDYQRNDPRQF